MSLLMDDFITPLPNEDLITLIIYLMRYPLEVCQVVAPGLDKYTCKELEIAFTNSMKAPPDIFVESSYSKEDFGYTVEEDYSILHSYKIDSNVFPIRHKKTTEDRIIEIRDQDDEVINKLAKMMLNEELFSLTEENSFESIEYLRNTQLEPKDFDSCRCSIPISPTYIDSFPASDELITLHSQLSLISESYFMDGDLAMLRASDHYYMMKSAAILLGRSTDKTFVDIDLSYGLDPFCTHLSRNQAIISFLEDSNFYIENIGLRSFRVNGVLIPPNSICQLNEGSILDFSGYVLLFLPNSSMVEQIH